jgi:hypothetical protein
MFSRQFSSKAPTFAYYDIKLDYLEDETSLLNIGQYQEEQYMQI